MENKNKNRRKMMQQYAQSKRGEVKFKK